MKKVYSLLFSILLIASYSCSSDDDSNNGPDGVQYNIVNIGNGGVTSIDSSITDPLMVVQAVPAVQNTDYPRSIPIILFFNSKIYLNSLNGNIQVTQDGEPIGGTVTINEGANGFAIMTFTPSETFDSEVEIVFSLTDLQNAGGNGFSAGSYSLTYETNNMSNGDFDGNGDFSSNQGVLFLGDGAIMQGAQGCVSPYSGGNFAAITTGDQLISNGNSIGGASSMMVLGAINQNISSLSFQYNFISSEFNEYVGSIFDDSVIVTIVGPNGAHSEFLTSVNTIGIDGNTQCIGFPNMPDAGDNYAGATGWTSATMNFQNVGSPAYAIFMVSDVGDTIYSSVLAIDAVSY